MKDNNRIGQGCWFKPPKAKEYERGTLRAWSTDHEEYESGPGLSPVGVIEATNGQMHSIHVNRISFSPLAPKD